METISSLQNQKIKNVIRLSEKASERNKQQLFTIEGWREITIAASSGISFEQIYICNELFGNKDTSSIHCNNISLVTPDVFKKMAYREKSDGIIAVAKLTPSSLNHIKLSSNPLIIVIENVEKPGNLGAILRTADAANADAVIICDMHTDLYNPNVIRASIGTLFSVQIACSDNAAVLAWLKKNNIKPYAAALTANALYQNTNLAKPIAIVMGTEADGLSDFWLNNAEQIKIPMKGKIDSLNVSTACAILTFEAMRQRNFQ